MRRSEQIQYIHRRQNKGLNVGLDIKSEEEGPITSEPSFLFPIIQNTGNYPKQIFTNPSFLHSEALSSSTDGFQGPYAHLHQEVNQWQAKCENFYGAGLEVALITLLLCPLATLARKEEK